MPKRYAALRMNPVATVAHFNYPEVTAAAESMSPKTYLVYIEEASSSCVPTSESPPVLDWR